jgi:hypothetical protein
MENKDWTKHFRRTYIQHVAFPLSHMKVPKVEVIVELVNGTFVGCFWQIPLRSNGSILKASFFQGRDFFVFIIEGFVLTMELWCN